MTESRDDNDPIFGAVFFVPEEAPDELGVTTDHAARALAHAGFDKSQAVKFWQARIAAGQVKPYGRRKSDARRTYLFRAEQVLVTAILHRLAECGLTGEPIAVASRELGRWNLDHLEGQEPPAPNPAAWVLRGYLEGHRNFGFELATIRNTTGRGDLKFTARVRHYDLESNNSVGTSFWNPGESWERRSLWVLDLDPILEHITRDKPVVGRNGAGPG